MRADLHMHTYYSDGKYSPAELAARAREAGVELVSMTDHDSLAGLEEKGEAARREGLAFVPGWEVSAYAGDAKVHVLGYGCRPDGAYTRFLEARRQGGIDRAAEMIALANAHFGLDVTMEDVERLHVKKEAPLHTMHVVGAYSQRLHIGKGELYLSAFATGGPCYSSLGRPTPQDALAVIHATGGLAVVAHPGRIPLPEEERGRLLDALVEEGLDGIECYHSDHTALQAEAFAAYARGRRLLVTGGSDFHIEGRNRVLGLPAFEPSEDLLATLLAMGGDR